MATGDTPVVPAFAIPIATLMATGDTAVVHFFLRSGPVAKIVLGILVLMSLSSWYVLLQRLVLFRRTARQNRGFLDVFRKAARFSDIGKAASDHRASSLVGLFQAGYLEIDTQIKALKEPQKDEDSFRLQSLVGLERTLHRAANVELRVLAHNTSWLATTAAAAPFIGLFGTVWGIMIAFNDIGTSGTASITAVAPGIAEALVNTAAGLVAAIPALVGYNYLATRLRQLRAEMDDFTLEFLNLAERSFG